MSDLFGLPGVGKSKMVRKLLKKLNKRRKKMGLAKLRMVKVKNPLLNPVDLSGYLMPPHITNRIGKIQTTFDKKAWREWAKMVTQPSNSRYNVADRQGNPIDDRIIDGQPNMPLPGNPLEDEDGDEHSPTWFLDRWLVARQEYLTLHGKQLGAVTQDVVDAHMLALDEALKEVELAEKQVDRLFPDYSGE